MRAKTYRTEDRLKALDVIEREKAARPVDTGRDILRRPLDGMDERFGFASDSHHLKY